MSYLAIVLHGMTRVMGSKERREGGQWRCRDSISVGTRLSKIGFITF